MARNHKTMDRTGLRVAVLGTGVLATGICSVLIAFFFHAFPHSPYRYVVIFLLLIALSHLLARLARTYVLELAPLS